MVSICDTRFQHKCSKLDSGRAVDRTLPTATVCAASYFGGAIRSWRNSPRLDRSLCDRHFLCGRAHSNLRPRLGASPNTATGVCRGTRGNGRTLVRDAAWNGPGYRGIKDTKSNQAPTEYSCISYGLQHRALCLRAANGKIFVSGAGNCNSNRTPRTAARRSRK